jgi:DNA polymerase
LRAVNFGIMKSNGPESWIDIVRRSPAIVLCQRITCMNRRGLMPGVNLNGLRVNVGCCSYFQMTNLRAKAARDLLGFYLEAGVDAVLTDVPVNRLEASPAPDRDAAGAPETADSRKSPNVPPSPSPAGALAPDRGRGGSGATTPMLFGTGAGTAGATAAPEVLLAQARDAANSAGNLDELRSLLGRFEGCSLKATATQLVFADGNPKSRVMFVGEAPGRDEDIAGLPFVGRSGKLLDRMLAAIGLDRNAVYIANIVPWRPPGNRTPTPQEAAICLPFILRQIELAAPDILVCLGKPSTAALLGVDEGIRRLRGRWFPFRTGGRDIRALPTYHPAYLLRSPLEKRLAWRDFLAIKTALEAGAGGSSASAEPEPG